MRCPVKCIDDVPLEMQMGNYYMEEINTQRELKALEYNIQREVNSIVYNTQREINSTMNSLERDLNSIKYSLWTPCLVFELFPSVKIHKEEQDIRPWSAYCQDWSIPCPQSSRASIRGNTDHTILTGFQKGSPFFFTKICSFFYEIIEIIFGYIKCFLYICSQK